MLLDTIILIGAAQGLIMSIFLWLKKNKNPAEMVLSFWIPFMVIHLSLSFLLRNNTIESDFLRVLNGTIPFLQAPMIYIYFSVLFLGRIQFKRISYHFAPALMGFIYPLLGYSIPILGNVLSWYIILSVPIYSIWILLSWLRIKERTTTALRQKSQWLIYPLIGLILIWTCFIIVRFVPAIKILNLHSYFFIAVTFFVYLVAFNLFRMGQQTPFVSIQDDESKLKSLESAIKYSKSGLSNENAKDIHQRLCRLMEEQKPYLDPELSLASLASTLEVRPNHLSQVINEKEGCTLNDFLNKYRVSFFITLCKNKNTSRDTILRMALESGFNSKSSFNRIFKKEMGISPSEHIAQLNTQ